ncbi:MAG: phage tail tape measure protein [Paludibacteraceae bacterium]|nr:phage tail tape measure protein [Paludibacteraceae bacterium]
MSDYSTNASVNLTINGQQAEQTLVNLKQAALNLTNEIAKAAAAGDKVTLKKLRRELNDTNRKIKEIESATMQVDAVMRRLDKATPRDLQKSLATLNKQLDYMERGSNAWNEQVKKIKLVKNEISKVNAELGKSQTMLERFNNTWQRWQTVAVGGVAALTGAVMAGKQAVQMYAEMDQEMASVRKYTGLTAEQVEHLNEEFKKIDTRSSREQLNQLAQEAGRLGKTSEKDVLGFVRAADQINVALDDLGEGATLQLSKLTNIFGDEERLGTEQSLLAVGSVINELSQNCTASAGYLSSFAQRLAGVGAQAGMTVPQIMAFGAVLDSQGQKVEMSATALSKLIMNLFKETETIASATGLNLNEFNAALQRSTNEGLLMLLRRLHELGGMDVLAPVFKDMGENGARASAVISALAGNIDMLIWEQEEAQKAYEEATSVTKEFNVQNTTVQANLDKARKGFKEMAIQLGQELAPVMKHFVSSTSASMRVLLTMIKFVKENKVAITSLAAAIATYTVAVNLAAIKDKLHTAYIVAKSAAMHLHKVAVLAASVAYNRMTGNVTRANAAMKLLNATMKTNPWGLLASLIVGAGVALAGYIKKQREAVTTTNTLDSVRKTAAQNMVEETNKINLLVAAANNEKLSLEERKKAVDKLNGIIPNYNAQLDATTGKYQANKKALDDYLEALRYKYELEEAKDKLAEIGRQKAELNIKKAEQNAEIAKLGEERATASTLAQNQEKTGSTVLDLLNQGGAMQASGYMVADIDEDIQAAKRNLAETDKELQALVEQEKIILGEYGEGLMKAEAEFKEIVDDVDVVVPTPSVVPTPEPESTTPTNKFQAEDDWKEREEALNRIAYAKGEKDYDAYIKRMLAIQVEYHQKKLAHTDLVGNEQVTIEASYYEALRKQATNAIEGTVEQENEAYQQQLAALQQRYIDGEMTARQYQNAMELQELEHLRKLAGLYEEGSKERLKAEKNYQDASRRQQMKHLEEDRKLQEKMREEYFTKAYQVPDNDSYQRDLRNLEIVHKEMLKACGNNSKERLQIERAFQEAKYQLGRKYNVKNAKELKKSFRSAMDDVADWLESDGGQAFSQSLDTVLSGMSAIFSEVSDLVQAQLDIETAKITSVYDAQISAAEGNKYKEVQLEQQKQKELGKAKAEANKKMFAMQVIQAVAQTAMSAIAAYSSAAAIPVVGFVMAPIAAAMAIAAGALQIASIKKQQEASAAVGYASGGFTPAGPPEKEVGVVHAGEWVASQKLLANPEARAIINTLDYAQRTNTIGSLRAQDVSSTITAPVKIAKASEDGRLNATLAATAKTLATYSSTMKDLSSRLNEPFVTVNTVTGDTGIKKAQDEYEQLIRNKTPKSRR